MKIITLTGLRCKKKTLLENNILLVKTGGDQYPWVFVPEMEEGKSGDVRHTGVNMASQNRPSRIDYGIALEQGEGVPHFSEKPYIPAEMKKKVEKHFKLPG